MDIEQPIIYKTERINKKKAQWVINNFDKIKLRPQIDEDEKKQIKNITIDYCNKIIKSKDGTIKIMYTKSKNQTTGRYYSKNGLQTIVREIRHTLCRDDYIDIDMVNSEAVILLNYCKLNKIDCNNLEYYVEHRNEIINDIVDNHTDLSYGDVKMEFLKIINGGGINKDLSDNEYITEFYDELKNVRTEIIKLNPNIIEFVKKTKENKTNNNASAVAYLYQIIENKILMLADDYLTKLNFSVDALIFDGFLVKNTPTFNNDVLEVLNEYIYEKTKYEIEFVMKEMNEGYNITEDDLKDNIEIKEENKIISNKLKDIIFYLKSQIYDNIEDLKKDVADKCKNTIYIFMDGATMHVAIKKDYSYDNNTQCMELSQYINFAKNYNTIDLKYYENDKLKSVRLPTILVDIQELCNVGYYIKPYHTFEEHEINHNGYLNIFSPMIASKYETYDVSKIEIILNHIKQVWANNDEFIYKYILSYFHRIIRTPWDRSKICMVINGEMGCGKSTVIEMMIKYIFGSNCGHQTQGLKSICSRFQGWLENKLLVLAEEPTQMTDMNFSEYVEKMKDFITSNKCEVEKKGIDKYTIDAFHTLIITCNHLKGINVPNDKERRYFIIDCNSCYIGNVEYFDRLNECLDNKDNMNIFFSFLYDYNDTIPLHPIPITKIKQDLINDNMSMYEKFLFHKEFRYDINTEEELTTTSLYINFTSLYESM